jgi:hypothetical protein
MAPETLSFQFGAGFGRPPLFGLLFAVMDTLNLHHPREMAAWQFRQRHGEVEGTTEPSDTHVLVVRVFAGFFVLLGPVP